MTMQTEDLDIESVILDAELLIKYNMPERGIAALEQAVDYKPESIRLREKLRDLYLERGQADLAASQYLALSGLYVRAGNFDEANRCLLEARQLNPRVTVTLRMQELKRLEQGRTRGTGQLKAPAAAAPAPQPRATLSGNLSDVSIFDIVQILENNHLTGILSVRKPELSGRVYFTEGLIVNAAVRDTSGLEAFRQLAQDANGGFFVFEKSQVGFARVIQASSNTSLILDLLREYDEEHRFDDQPMENA
jgi:tetratricopeptide (TPR) repeat protein